MPCTHTLPPVLTHSFTAQCIRQEHASFAGCLTKVETETKAPHACACSFNTNRTKTEHTHTHTEGYFNGEQWSSLQHCYQQSRICKSNRGSAHGRSGPHANDVKKNPTNISVPLIRVLPSVNRNSLCICSHMPRLHLCSSVPLKAQSH